MAYSVAQPLLPLYNTRDCKTATRISEKLIAWRAAACVNILSAVRLVYRWQGNIESTNGVTLLIKTTDKHDQQYDKTNPVILAEHPYEVPKFLDYRSALVYSAYLRRITEQCDG